VGSLLAEKMLDLGNEVTGLVRRRADGKIPHLLKERHIISNIRLLNGDITDLSSILFAIQEVQPDWIFHLAAQSFIPDSFRDPVSTFKINCLGTQNLLEAVRLKNFETKIIFAGTSEEYGLQFINPIHFESMVNKYGPIHPRPYKFPEIPIDEEAHMRPMSPYGTSKLYGDYCVRNYNIAYGLNTIVSRAFNHEGAGRGHNFVTSSIIRQLVSVHLNEHKSIKIGNVQAFRDWSHVDDIVDGYYLLADKARAGSVYVQGSMRCNSIITYVLYALSSLGYETSQIYSLKDEKKVTDPLAKSIIHIGDIVLESNILDEKLMSGNLQYNLSDRGLVICTNKQKFVLHFDESKFRPVDVPVLLSNTSKIKQLGFANKKKLTDIINDQINYYLDKEHRENLVS
jgi:GDPmannose 4,6-dehydratase